jgi:hypothetical protein
MDTGAVIRSSGTGLDEEPVAEPAPVTIVGLDVTESAGALALAVAVPTAETVIFGVGVAPAAVDAAPAETVIVGVGAAAAAVALAAGG